MSRTVSMQFGKPGGAVQNNGGSGGGGSQFNLLWTNPNPNASFAAQDIALNLSNYNAVYINYMQSSGNQTLSVIILVGSPMYYARFITNSGSNIRFYSRTATVESDKVHFENCGRYTQGTSGSTTDNASMIPQNIYGIKF